MPKPLNNPIATKTVNNPGVIENFGCILAADLFCTDSQDYKTTAMYAPSYRGELQNATDKYANLVTLDMILQPTLSGRCALIYDNSTTSSVIVLAVDDTVRFDSVYYNDYSEQEQTYTNSSQFPEMPGRMVSGLSGFSSNVPIFSDFTAARNYLYAQDEDQAKLYLSQAINYQAEEYMPETTKTWTYSCVHSNVNLLRGTITPTSEIGWRTLKIQSNTQPILYVNEDTFEAGIIIRDVLASVYVAGPEYVVDNIPPSQWTEGELAYNGPFYIPLDIYMDKYDETPPDGPYVYPTDFRTDFEIFGSRADAEEALATGDHSKAISQGPRKSYDVKIGDEEEETEFGGGGFMSPFFTILTGSKSDIHRLAEVLFTTDGNLWDDIKKGLELYGSNPIDYVIDVKSFGFNLADVTTQSTRSDVWFGSYKHHFENPFNEIINLSANYLDAGEFVFRPIQYCYLDFSPYTSVSIYIPYHGWEEIDQKKYYNKHVQCRYYVDVLTGQALFVTICDGVLCDQFGPFELATEMPLTGTNFSQWAQGQVRLLTQSASSLLGGIAGGATSGSVAGFAASSLQSLIPATQALQEAKQQGGVRNTMVTKGNFTAQIGNYMPGYVMFRFDIHEMLEPDLLDSLAGRPAYASGNLRNFSGFLSGDVVKIDTSGMTENEAHEIYSLISQGIYL